MSVFKKEKRVPRCFTIREELAVKLDEMSERFSTPRSKIVEHCLEHRDSLDKVYEGLIKIKKGNGDEET